MNITCFYTRLQKPARARAWAEVRSQPGVGAGPRGQKRNVFSHGSDRQNKDEVFKTELS